MSFVYTYSYIHAITVKINATTYTKDGNVVRSINGNFGNLMTVIVTAYAVVAIKLIVKYRLMMLSRIIL